MTNTPNLALPLLAAAQAQKHVTVNEALGLIDALAQIAITSVGAISPPATPAEGERHIIGTGATGAWSGWDNNIALFSGGAWLRLIPQVGWLAWDVTASELLVWNGSAWASFVPKLQNLSGVGIGTSSDATNRLAVSAAATLLSHAGNGHQLKINKAAATDTASLLFQTNWSGRAEMGTAGSDDFTLKVSGDGSNWLAALCVNRTTGILDEPRRPRFKAYTNYDNHVALTTWTKIAINTIEANDQGVFDTATSLFTAPASGTYLLGASLLYKANASSSSRMRARLLRNGASVINGAFGEVSGPHRSRATALWLQSMAALLAGDTVELQGYFRGADAFFAANHTTFWGVKLG